MKYEAIFDIKINDKPTVTVRGGTDRNRTYLEFELPSAKRSIRADWTDRDVGKLRAGEHPDGMPVTITVDNQKPTNLYHRNGLLFEKGKTRPWSPPDGQQWATAFGTLAIGSPLAGARDFSSFINCLGGYATAGVLSEVG
jgi:hypothetical protein